MYTCTEIAGINWVIQVLSHIEQEYQESLIQGKIHIQQNLIGDFES